MIRLARTALLAALGTAVRGWSQAPPSPAPQSGALPPKCEQVAERPANTPLYRQDSSDEDWAFLCDPGKREDPWDAIKYIALGPESWYLSLGGELREQYELYRNEFWGLAPESPNGYNLSRVMGHADVHFGQRFRAFAELTSSLEFGRKGGPRPFDKNKLDVGQAFFEFNPWIPKDGESTPLSIKVGRQELNYGDGTLIATRDLNVRLPFDGAKLVFRPQKWRIDAFAVKPVLLGPNFFDGAPDHAQRSGESGQQRRKRRALSGNGTCITSGSTARMPSFSKVLPANGGTQWESRCMSKRVRSHLFRRGIGSLELLIPGDYSPGSLQEQYRSLFQRSDFGQPLASREPFPAAIAAAERRSSNV